MNAGRAGLLLAGALLAGALLAGAARAQELSLGGFVGRTNNQELRTPFGPRAALAIYPTPNLGLRLSYDAAWASTRYEGVTCDSYWPENGGCLREPIRSAAFAGLLGYGVVLRSPVSRGWSATAAVEGRTVRIERLDLRGAGTGRSITPYTGGYESRQGLASYFRRNGWSADLALRRNDFPAPHVSAELGLAAGSFNLDACATDSYVPFCWPVTTAELRLGLVYRP